MRILRSGRFILAALFTLSCATFVFAQDAPLQGFDEYVIDILPPPNACALWRGIPTLNAVAHFS